jgi:hypothetical protein
MYYTPPIMKDIHAVQIQDYQHTKKMTVEEQKKYYRTQAKQILDKFGYDLIWDKKTSTGKLVKI